MPIDITVDKLTPCLIEVSTGKIMQTTFSIAKPDEIDNLQSKGWLFDWTGSDLAYCNIYKLQIKDDDAIQGLVAAEIVRGAVYVHLIESAPHNQLPNKMYEGVGGHLFAIAIKLSLALGFGGYIYFEAKNQQLADHYAEVFGAKLLRTRIHEYRMDIDEMEACKLVEKYTLEGDLNVR